MFNKIKLFIARRKFDRVVNKKSFAYQYAFRNKGEEQLPEYFDSNKKYVNYNKGDIVPLEIKGCYKAFYKIMGWHRSHGDYAGWDDGRQYALKLHHVEFNK